MNILQAMDDPRVFGQHFRDRGPEAAYDGVLFQDEQWTARGQFQHSLTVERFYRGKARHSD